jgi:cytochrome c oxidase subunit 2
MTRTGLKTLGFSLGAWLSATTAAWAAQPIPGAKGFQDAVTPIGAQAHRMHDFYLMPILTAVVLVVMGLLIYVMIKFRASANPNPSKTTHNTLVEVVWTVVPVILLAIIAVPSFRLLYAEHNFDQKFDLTIKATGHQWYWSYEYPDHAIAFDATMLSDEEARKAGEPRLLATDNRVVVPVGATVKVEVTAADVIHSWAMPAFFVKMDAVPGRLNETWFRAEKEGVYYGQCSELCGIRHGYMPITVEVKSQAEYAAWLEEAKVKFAANRTTTQFASNEAVAARP